jgi:hypothetical protein
MKERAKRARRSEITFEKDAPKMTEKKIIQPGVFKVTRPQPWQMDDVLKPKIK